MVTLWLRRPGKVEQYRRRQRVDHVQAPAPLRIQFAPRPGPHFPFLIAATMFPLFASLPPADFSSDRTAVN